jgi:hypothetical protein
MKSVGIALAIVGYALIYSGASNLFSGGQGWGFLQALLNKGDANAGAGKYGTAVGETLGGLLEKVPVPGKTGKS